MRVTDTDAKSYRNKDPQKILEAWCHFTPFIVSVDGLVGKDARMVTLAENQGQKMGKLYSHLCGFLQAQFSIMIVRASHIYLRRSRVPTSHMSVR
jgi:hypothetical protein